ncbi:hypothetical protein CGQ22_07620 [Bacillus sp. M13(2017)]|nr:hypothetical protein CGQ22_07620 [Bacillus sp. M13(2017)]
MSRYYKALFSFSFKRAGAMVTKSRNAECQMISYNFETRGSKFEKAGREVPGKMPLLLSLKSGYSQNALILRDVKRGY